MGVAKLGQAAAMKVATSRQGGEIMNLSMRHIVSGWEFRRVGTLGTLKEN